MKLRSSVWSGPVLKGQKASDSMNLPDEARWDETTCRAPVCQHPQCWASLRRIERGHPRILETSSKSPPEAEDKLPTLTIINITDTCLWAKKSAVQQTPSESTFPKERSLSLKPASKCHGRSRKALLGKGVTSHSTKLPKLSVLNLNDAELPFPGDVRNMVVTWVPEKAKKNMRSVGKSTFSSLPGKKRRKKRGDKAKSSLYFSGKQYVSVHSRSPGVIVPPPSPVHLLDQLSSEALPLWAHLDLLPQSLLEECMLAHEKAIALPEVNIELSKMKKSPPPEKNRPDSALSSKMYLSIHRVTLQRPSLRYPDHLRKLQSSLKRGPSISPAQESDENQVEQEEEEKKSSTRDAPVDDSPEYDLSSDYTYYSTSPESSVMYEPVYEDIDDMEETMVANLPSSQDDSPTSPSGSTDKAHWNPELKLLRILQASVEDEDESHLSRVQSEASLEA
ncbi:uncharacterized protein C9orf43 homolog [Acomys russatus]|uniref:uncharacterized protein C9orf43 homolog n=1 Tax=Acomys russatus TaxID=60746 RepID=UPI0021E2462C|nr:uncharacterized protein C9orf43 homolog [Acomys russatus]